MSELLSEEEAAKLIRVSVKYLIDTIVANGELTPVSGGLGFNAEDVYAYVELDKNRRKDALKDMVQDEEGLWRA